ncbi:MAG: signal peptidase I [Candidatus Hydrogenedentota bacterium]
MTGPWTWENAKAWLMVIAFVLLVRWLWFEPFSIPSGSMEPTLHGDKRFLRGDRVAVNKLAYGPRVPFTNIRLLDLGDPQRWDIVVFNTPEENAEHKVLIKRVVGLPGERVHISNGVLHVNGEPVPFPPEMPEGMRYTNELEELERGQRRYVGGEHMTYGVLPQDEYVVVPEGYYFVLGDNSARSRDGRYFGWVPEENIIGRAFCVWWPWSHRRDFTGFSTKWWGAALLYGVPLLFVLYWFVTGFIAISLRVRHTHPGGVPARGEHVVVNRLMTGLRIPFTNAHLIPGRPPREGELLAYAADREGSYTPQIVIGRVVGLPGQYVATEGRACRIDGREVGVWPNDAALKDGRIPEDGVVVAWDAPAAEGKPVFVEWVPRENIIGNVVSVWWPLHRARAVRVQPAASKEAI